MSPKITYLSYKPPEHSMSVAEFTESLDKDFLKSVSKSYGVEDLKRNELFEILSFVSNIESIYVDSINNEYLLIEALVREYLEAKSISPQDVSYIIYTKGSLVGKTKINIPYYIQTKFGFLNATVFSLEQECCSSLLAVNILDMLLKARGGGRGIILTSNYFPSLESRLMGLFVVSDATGLIEMSDDDHGLEVVAFKSVTNGNITSVSDFTDKAEEVVRTGSGAIKDLIISSGLNLKDIHTIIPQNTNLSGWNAYFEKLDITPDKLFKGNFGGVGHWGDVDFARNLSDMYKTTPDLPAGSVLLAYALGTGTSFNVLILKQK